MRTLFRVLGFVIAASAVSACSHMPDISGLTEPAATADATPRERVRLAVELLGQGEERRARAELQAALEAQPGNSTARRLMEQIEGDPRRLLNGEPRPYVVRQGETMSQIAERHLGDPLLFYALARYNRISAPNQLSAGQTLMVPMRPGVTVREAASRPPEGLPVTAAAPAQTAPSSANASRANQLRLQALQLLNSGQVDNAVSLLRQARGLDQSNPAIQRDLERAERLQTSLRGG